MKDLMEAIASRGLVGWMPLTTTSTAQTVGAIAVPPGQEMDYEISLLFLADRVQAMIDAEEDSIQAVRWLEEALDAEGLLYNFARSKEAATENLIADNPLLRARLRMIGVPGGLPKRVIDENPEAIEIIKQTSLENWVTALLVSPIGA